MASALLLLLLTLTTTTTIRTCGAADPAPLQDYCVADTAAKTWTNGLQCIDPATATSAHFQTSALATPADTTSNAMRFNCTFAAAGEALPGLNTLGATLARCHFGVGGATPPHLHARATELVFVASGTLDWGFVDTGNRLFRGRAFAGDVFVVPQGLIHYAANNGTAPALAVVAFTSQSPGVSLVPSASFASEPAIPADLLARAFRMSKTDVGAIRRALGAS